MGGDGCLHGRFTYYFVLGWPPVRKVLAQIGFLLDRLHRRYFSVSFFRWHMGGGAPAQEYLIDPAFRKQIWVVVGGVIAMAFFGAWRLPKLVV
jgi:hypothetical protein